MSESGIADLADVPPGPVLSVLLYRFDLDQLTPQEAVPVLKAWSRQRAHDHARMARTMARVADLSRHADDLMLGEWAGSEIAAALTWSESKAGREVEFAETLMTLPQVLAAFEVGRIDSGKAWVFTDVLDSTDLTVEQLAAICAMFVPLAPTLTAGQLRHRLVRAILAIDAEWADRRYRRAVAGRRVCGYLAADGTATISGSGLPPDQAAAACARVDAVADQLQRAGYPGTVGQIRADVFLRLLDGRLTGLTTPQIITALLADAAAAANPTTPSAGDPRRPARARCPGPARPDPGSGLCRPRLPTPRHGVRPRPHPRPHGGRVDHHRQRGAVVRLPPRPQTPRRMAAGATHAGMVSLDQPAGRGLHHPRRTDHAATARAAAAATRTRAGTEQWSTRGRPAHLRPEAQAPTTTTRAPATAPAVTEVALPPHLSRRPRPPGALLTCSHPARSRARQVVDDALASQANSCTR